MYHIPALLKETIEGLNINSDGIYVDATFGGGGHSLSILEQLGKKGKLFGFDHDEDAAKNAPEDRQFTFVRSNFRFLKNFLRYHNIEKVDGILADLGVSFHHFDCRERGFSFRFDSLLDMRMNRRAKLTAAEVINSYSQENLANIFYSYGELQQAKLIAKVIVTERTKQQINTTTHLVETLKSIFPKGKEKKYITLVFQALRIEVNDELTALKSFLQQAVDVLKSQGRIAIITYHSLEDRIVKNFMRCGNFEGKIQKDFYGNPISLLKPLYNKPIIPSDKDIERNPRSRSAKLRIAVKC